MFKIVDGREYFYQWDLDRQIAVEDNSIAEVHFCNRTDECSLVVEVKDGLANVPNLILQKHFDIRVFGYDGKATRYDEVFKVKPRTKPTDYVYTEVEIKNYDELAARIDEIERNGISEEIVTEAVENYLEKNPVDLEGYATEDYVDEAVKNIEVDVDLTGYATEDYVDEAIGNIKIDIPDVDLTGYATEDYVDEAIAQAQLGGEEIDLSNYAKKSDIPTKVSQLSNDKGYLTKHQDISHLATIGQVQTVEGKIPTKTSQLTNDSGYLTQHQDLSGKADRDHTHPSYALKTEIPDVSDFISEIPSEYITESELNAKGYLTEHQSLEGYATEAYVDNEISKTRVWVNASSTLSERVKSIENAGYATEQYVDDAIANIEIPEGTDNSSIVYLTQETETPFQLVKDILAAGKLPVVVHNKEYYYLAKVTSSRYYFEFRQGTYGYGLELSDLAGGAWGAYTKSLQSALTVNPEGTPTKTLTSLTINGTDYAVGEPTDLTNYYTKTEIDNMFNGIATAEGGAY